jgi:hypothetical protein
MLQTLRRLIVAGLFLAVSVVAEPTPAFAFPNLDTCENEEYVCTAQCGGFGEFDGPYYCGDISCENGACFEVSCFECSCGPYGAPHGGGCLE